MTFKEQLAADITGTFLNADEYAELCHVKYWRRGDANDPDEMDMMVVTNNDGNMNSVWNTNKSQQRAGHDPALYQIDRIVFVPASDFRAVPRKNRNIQIDKKKYNILSVAKQDGMYEIELRRMDE